MPKTPIQPPRNHTIEVGDEKELSIVAAEFYSADKIVVEPGQSYSVIVSEGATWKDWFVDTTAAGYFNPLAKLWGLRVRNAKCFALCGAINDDEAYLFAVEPDKPIKVDVPGATTLSFFANDTRRFYWNNSGSIAVKVKRIS